MRVAIGVAAVCLLVSGGVAAQTVPEVVKPQSQSPTIPPSGGANGATPRSENPLTDGGGVRPIPDSGVIRPPASSGETTPVIKPPATGTMPVIPPPGATGDTPRR